MGFLRQSAGKERRSTSDITKRSFSADHRPYTLPPLNSGVYGRGKGMGKYYFRRGVHNNTVGCVCRISARIRVWSVGCDGKQRFHGHGSHLGHGKTGPDLRAEIWFGALPLRGYGWRRRQKRSLFATSEIVSSDDQDNTPPILAFPSHRANVARRAA